MLSGKSGGWQKMASSSFEKGDKIGEGGFGTVYEVADQPNLVMKEATASGGKANTQLAIEADNLKLLNDFGYPTVFKEFAWFFGTRNKRRLACTHWAR